VPIKNLSFRNDELGFEMISNVVSVAIPPTSVAWVQQNVAPMQQKLEACCFVYVGNHYTLRVTLCNHQITSPTLKIISDLRDFLNIEVC